MAYFRKLLGSVDQFFASVDQQLRLCAAAKEAVSLAVSGRPVVQLIGAFKGFTAAHGSPAGQALQANRELVRRCRHRREVLQLKTRPVTSQVPKQPSLPGPGINP